MKTIITFNDGKVVEYGYCYPCIGRFDIHIRRKDDSKFIAQHSKIGILKVEVILRDEE